jgi:hypothetical protein
MKTSPTKCLLLLTCAIKAARPRNAAGRAGHAKEYHGSNDDSSGNSENDFNFL